KRSDLYLNRHSILDKQKSSFISSVLKRRIAGEPIQYILNKADFFGFEFYVSPDVLIPRPETEVLVEACVRLMVKSSVQRTIDILDIGTGSGCISVLLAKLLPEASIVAVDISSLALNVARKNAKLHQAEKRIKFIQSDLFKNLDPQNKYDLIISNPPYVPSAEIEALQREVQHEPRLSLDGGNDGLDHIRRIIQASPRFLKESGLLILEIGFGQLEKIKNLFGLARDFNIMEIIKDYNGIDRVVIAKKR
ncbi:MAG: peptide chain release factor N(5)-glutamine methyltransferase, partial [Candidatus Omnitrophica bacterium]|nr:peptide chain release factor N(5)-glutamine methyltransferase [Candidatus Omnitrophota bacterium]